MIDFIYIVGAFLVGLVVATKVRWFCEAQGMMDTPGPRSSHTKTTPRGGGLAIVLLVIPASLVLVFLNQIPEKKFMLALTFTGALMAALGWLDDVKSRPVWLRLLVQLGCLAICVGFLPQVFDFVPLWLEKTLLLLAWAWFVNLYNFMDGIDGLAASQAIFLAVALTFFIPAFKPVLLVLAGVAMGFLRVNWQPAKVFMGDVGSLFLGHFLGGLMLINLTLESFFPLLTLGLLFTADATATLLLRLYRRRKPWEAHRDHWYQRATRAGLTHAQVVLRAMGLNLVLFVLAFAGWYGGIGPLALVLGLMVMALAAWRIRWLEGK